ncbi:hypothetical protein J6590_093885 [Homalodisca vitripennis]|nr:hypothetical protein J6590_093885 [Homalodisca vitripennis]
MNIATRNQHIVLKSLWDINNIINPKNLSLSLSLSLLPSSLVCRLDLNTRGNSMGDNKQNNKQTEFSDTNMAGTRTERKDEGDGVVSEGERRRMEAEKEFLERQYKERKLRRTVRGDADSAASSQMESESETDTYKKRTRWRPNDGGIKRKVGKLRKQNMKTLKEVMMTMNCILGWTPWKTLERH